MTEKLHFDDLTKITCPPGMLDGDTLLRLKDWPYGWQYWINSQWLDSGTLFTHSSCVFRAKAAPLTQDVIPWHLLDDRLKVSVRNSKGATWAAEIARINRSGEWWVMTGDTIRIDLLKDYQRGTVDWKDSLQPRPEGV